MERYDLAALSIRDGAGGKHAVSCTKAQLTVVSEYGTRLWYVDMDGIADAELLRRFAENEDIGVEVEAVTIGGKRLAGRGYFHPNPQHRSAAIRGDGGLVGYDAHA